MKTVAIINQKGGVGKTTTAHALGTGLHLTGYRVLFVDLDPQGNLSYIVNAAPQDLAALDVLQQNAAITKVIQHTDQGDILASSPALTGADITITGSGKEYRLRDALENIQDSYDYCILDTPPALGILTVNSLTACHDAIVTAQADVFSLQGISRLYDTMETVKQYCNPSLTVKGILLTRYSQRTIISREVTELLEQTAVQLNTKLFTSKIREATAIKEAQAMRQSIYSYAPGSNVCLDYMAFVEEYLSQNS